MKVNKNLLQKTSTKVPIQNSRSMELTASQEDRLQDILDNLAVQAEKLVQRVEIEKLDEMKTSQLHFKLTNKAFKEILITLE